MLVYVLAVLVGRDDVVTETSGHARAGRSTLLSGPAGCGLSAVLAAVAEALGTAVVHGTDAVDGVPFVPFAGVLVDSGMAHTEALVVYRDLPLWLADKVIVVDDVEHLDLASSALLSHAVRAGATAVVGLRDVAAVAPSFAADTASWRRAELTPLDDEDALALAEQRLGMPLTPSTAARLLHRAAGLPAVIADLLVDARSGGTTTAAGFDVPTFRPSARSLGLRGHQMQGLALASAEFLAALVLAGTLPVTAGNAAAADLLERGLVRQDGAALVVAGELVRDMVLPQLVPDRWPHLARVGADLLRETTEWDEVRRRLQVLSGVGSDLPAFLSVVEWWLHSGLPHPAMHMLATREEPAAVLLRARAHAALGQREEAFADLDQVAAISDDPDLLTRLAHEWAGLLRGRLSEETLLRAQLVRLVERLPDGPERARVQALIERRRVLVGDLGDQDADTTVHDPSTRALTAVMAGELRVAQHIVAESPNRPADADPESERTMRALVEFLQIVYDGQMAAARAVADAEYHRARKGDGASAGLWGYNRAKISLHSGQYLHTVALARTAGRHLAWRDDTGLAMPCLALEVAGLARVGDLARAETLAATFTAEERRLPRVAIGIARVAAERHRWAGEPEYAADVLATAGRAAMAGGEAYSGLLALDEAFMLRPRADVAAELTGHAERSALLTACAERAAAVMTADARGVEGAAEFFETLPMPGRAAHAWRTAEVLHRSAGREVASRRAAQRSLALVSAWNLPCWPEVDQQPTARLTLREWQVAGRAVRRIRSREIADELGLSVRTVDNHLAAAFRKLGVGSRDELAAVLDASVAPIDVAKDVLELRTSAHAELTEDPADVVVDGSD